MDVEDDSRHVEPYHEWNDDAEGEQDPGRLSRARMRPATYAAACRTTMHTVTSTESQQEHRAHLAAREVLAASTKARFRSRFPRPTTTGIRGTASASARESDVLFRRQRHPWNVAAAQSGESMVATL